MWDSAAENKAHRFSMDENTAFIFIRFASAFANTGS